MARRDETGMDRLKRIKLWQWGLLMIFGGLVASALTAVQGPGGTSEVERAQALGRAFGALLPILIGIGLIVAHFVRGARR